MVVVVINFFLLVPDVKISRIRRRVAYTAVNPEEACRAV